MVLKGVRTPSSKMIEALCSELGLDYEERRYFGLLVLLEKSKKIGSNPRPILDELERLHPNPPNRLLVDIDRFALISEWYYLVIRQLADARPFLELPTWISSRLRSKISENEARKSLETLIRLKMLERNPKNGQLRKSPVPLTTTQDVPSSVIRSHHAQMLERAREALEEQAVDQREMTSLTLRFDRARTAEAKQVIRRFRDTFDKKFGNQGNDVFQLNIQLFSHTREEK